MNKIEVVSEIEVTLSVIGGKYKPLILNLLSDKTVQRFGEIRIYIANISQKTLTNQLRELEADGLVTREIFAEVPPRVEYTITDKGRSLIPILMLMCDWGYNNMGDRYTLLRPECD
ncbi:winged helix-turn-helix transcriptional regulator [Morganella psychrotolerans]|uniref:winged helix-turn-helix transcriptional regulator n=1 Tax=Morganella psychrotolerans TaxID=368603 RepID=UPI0039B010E3